MAELPERASVEYLKKLAKDRLDELRRLDPDAKLAAAQLAIAREHGFPSWRALKAEIDALLRGDLPRPGGRHASLPLLHRRAILDSRVRIGGRSVAVRVPAARNAGLPLALQKAQASGGGVGPGRS